PLLPPGASAPPPPPPRARQPPATDVKSLMAVFRVPPVITLLGDPVVTLNLYSGEWLDPGAYATDALDGPMTVVVVSAPPPDFTNTATNPLAPVVVMYIAVSAVGGLTAVATRSLHVVDACTVQVSTEFTCAKTRMCSVNGACGGSSTNVSDDFVARSLDAIAVVAWWNGDNIKGDDVVVLEMPVAVRAWIPLDTTPPTLTLLAGAYLTVEFVTAKGTSGVVTTVGVGEAYVDSGAVASKAPANNPSQVINLSGDIVVSGLDAVNTRAPTAEGAPFVVTYEVQDSAVPPNKAILRRRVVVACPSGESICAGDGGVLSCSDGGICGVGGGQDGGSAPMSSSMAAAMAGVGGSAATTAVSGTASLAVLGTNPMRVRAGTPYGACGGAIGMSCDPGVIATLDTPNDLHANVRACAEQAQALGVSAPKSYDAIGLLYCGIDVNVPGLYKVTYTVQAGSGPVASGVRTIIVEADCPAGEALCTTGACSSDGACADDLGNALTRTAAGGGSSLVDGFELPELVAPAANTPPRLALRTAYGFGSAVSIKQGTPYPMCAPGHFPTEPVPCDLGADAEDDEDGAAVHTSVLLCPPTNCMEAGSCNGHRTFQKDASSCGLDTSAKVGTTYLLDFVVYDKEGLNATISRVVTIVSRCPLDRPYLCSGSCEAVDCATLIKLLSAIAAAGGSGTAANALLGSPVLVLLPAASANLTSAALLGAPPTSQTVFAVFGTPAPVSLLPCASVAAAGSCAAAAVQLSANGSLVDLSPSVSVTEVTPTDDGTPLGRCSAAALSLGICLPGIYVLQYSVPGASQSAQLSVVVEQLAATEFAYTFEPPDGSSLSAATNFATQLSSNATLLLATVMEHMPLFGIDALTVRGAVLNSSAVVARVTGTAYDISVVLTVTTGSSTPIPLPGVTGRRRLHSAPLGIDAPDATTAGTTSSKQRVAAEHTMPPTTTSGGSGTGGAAGARLRVASACVSGVVATLLRVRPLIDDLTSVLACAGGSGDCGDGNGEGDAGDDGASSPAASSSSDGIHPAAAPTRRLMGLHSRRRQLLQSGCNAPDAATTPASGGVVVSGGATGSSCESAAPSEDAMYRSLIMGAASDVTAATTAIQASTDSMAVTIVPLVDTFDLYDTAARTAYIRMYNDVTWASGNVSAQLVVVDDLLSRTLVAQAAFNKVLSETGALMLSTLTLLQQQLTRTVISAQLVLEGLGILDEPTLSDFQQCVFNASIGRRFAFRVGASATSRRRSLLPTASGTPSVEPYVFQGYDVFPDAASFQYDLYDTWNADMARFVGSGLGNRVLSGLLLHTVRRPLASLVEEVRTSASASGMEARPRVCRSTGYPGLVTACRDEAVSTTVAYVDGGGVGSDPVFNPLSMLYNKQVSMSDFYNMADGNPEVNNVTGMPFGFFHTPLKGFADGYPLLFDTHVSEKRIVDLLHYVQDGGMLSAQLTRSMTLQMVMYNPQAVVFGYFSATFSWIDSGVISMTHKLMALPAVEYSHGVATGQLQTLLPDIFLILLVVAYIALTSWDIFASLRSQRKLAHMSKVSPVYATAASNPLWDAATGAQSPTDHAPYTTADHAPYTTARLAGKERHAGAGSATGGFAYGSDGQTSGVQPSAYELRDYEDDHGKSVGPPSTSTSPTFKTAPPFSAAAAYAAGAYAPAAATTPTSPAPGHNSRPGSPHTPSSTRPGPVAEGTEWADATPPTSSTSVYTSTRGGLRGSSHGGGIGNMGVAVGARSMTSPRTHSQRFPGSAASMRLDVAGLPPPGLTTYNVDGASAADAKDRAIETEIAEAALEAEDAVRTDRGDGVGGRASGAVVAVRRAQKYSATMSPFWIAFEAVLCALMVACVALWFVYAAQIVSSDVFVTRFDAYDADAFAPARFLLPTRDDSTAAAAQFAAETGRAMPPAATAGRWRLPANVTGLENAAKLASRVDEMYTIYVLYYFLQGFVLLGLIVRLIMYLSFQRRLSIIGGTLAALVPELFHFLLVVTTLFCMMAIFLNTVFGYRVDAAATFGEAMFTMFKMLVFGDDVELYNALTEPGLDAPLERSMASAFRGVVTVLVAWVLRMYLASFIILLYAGLNQYAKHMPGVPQDLRRMFKWWAQKVRSKAPSNVHIEKMLDKVLEEGGGPSGLLARVRSTVARSVMRGAAGPAVRADLGGASQSTQRGGGGVALSGFTLLGGSGELGPALQLASGRRLVSFNLLRSASLSAQRNRNSHSGADNGWLSASQVVISRSITAGSPHPVPRHGTALAGSWAASFASPSASFPPSSTTGPADSAAPTSMLARAPHQRHRPPPRAHSELSIPAAASTSTPGAAAASVPASPTESTLSARRPMSVSTGGGLTQGSPLARRASPLSPTSATLPTRQLSARRAMSGLSHGSTLMHEASASGMPEAASASPPARALSVRRPASASSGGGLTQAARSRVLLASFALRSSPTLGHAGVGGAGGEQSALIVLGAPRPLIDVDAPEDASYHSQRLSTSLPPSPAGYRELMSLPSAVRTWEDGLLIAASLALPPPADAREWPSDAGGAASHSYYDNAAALPLSSGGANSVRLNAEHVSDLAAICDVLMARFGTAGDSADAAGASGGGAPVMVGARSRKASTGHHALRQRLAMMAAGAGTTTAGGSNVRAEVMVASSVSDGDGADGELTRRLRKDLFRAAIVELAHAQGQLSAMRAAQAELACLAAALASALPPARGGRPRAPPPQPPLPPPSGSASGIGAAAERMGAAAMAAVAAFSRSGSRVERSRSIRSLSGIILWSPGSGSVRERSGSIMRRVGSRMERRGSMVELGEGSTSPSRPRAPQPNALLDAVLAASEDPMLAPDACDGTRAATKRSSLDFVASLRSADENGEGLSPHVPASRPTPSAGPGHWARAREHDAQADPGRVSRVTMLRQARRQSDFLPHGSLLPPRAAHEPTASAASMDALPMCEGGAESGAQLSAE
ncbi:hypothetical protein FOA52_005525, partial [Chlamydomonas sp. UWO 241]